MSTVTITYEKPYGTGYNPPTERSTFDWPFEKHLYEQRLVDEVAPPNGTLTGGMPYVFYQNAWGTCVSDALVGIKSFQEHLQTGQWLYDDWGKTDPHHDNSVDEFYLGGTKDATYENGWWVAGAMEYARTYGVTASNGHRYLIGSYYTLFDGNDLEANIQKSIALLNRPVQFGFPWHSHWWDVADPSNSYPNGVLPPIPAPGTVPDVASGHSMYIWRYITHPVYGKLYCARNSWSADWGVNGNIYLTSAHIASFYEAMVAIDR